MIVYVVRLNDTIIGVFINRKSATRIIADFERDHFSYDSSNYRFGVKPSDNGRYYRVTEHEVE